MDEKAAVERVKRRLYSLYPEQIDKLAKLARKAGIPQSQYLRELIDVAYADRVEKAN